MHKYIVLPLSLAIAACGSGDEEMAAGPFNNGEVGKGSYSATGEEANSQAVVKADEGVVRIAMGDKAVAHLPMDIKLYPGADIQTSMAGVGERKSGAMVVFTTSDSAEDVIDFYRKELESKGIGFKKEIRSGDKLTISGERTSGEGVHVSVTKSPDGRTIATIVASSAS
ncbi:hypothetical protein [uncultured Parasphingorhabdus sp.]|uniref:hypothetical protein n=1 Tax=uncultured Parasphingorhabdus sp. TaxID=2709694 RepID=UPI0030D7D34B|tara:strand:- start:11790 stop:12296 length:507 start_codon:yes stop_codon:yes gene_type:complete